MEDAEREELLRQIEERRNDPEFIERVKRIIEQQREILERLADT